MAKYIISIDKLPNQSFDVEIDDKRCHFEFITKAFFMYVNISIDEVEKLNGIMCLNKVDMIKYKDAGLEGKLYFEDTQGNLDPIYYGLGSRWILIYED